MTDQEANGWSPGPGSPPLGGLAPPLQCSRLLNDDFERPELCGKPGKWHIIWTADTENGVACDEHAEEARRRWVYFGMHCYDPICSMPGATYLFAEDRCIVDEGVLGLIEEAALAMSAPTLNGDPNGE